METTPDAPVVEFGHMSSYCASQPYCEIAWVQSKCARSSHHAGPPELVGDAVVGDAVVGDALGDAVSPGTLGAELGALVGEALGAVVVGAAGVGDTVVGDALGTGRPHSAGQPPERGELAGGA